MDQEIERQLLTVDDVARATGVPKGTWRRWCCKGKTPIPIIRLGRTVRFSLKDLDDLVAGRVIRQAARPVGRPTKAEQMARAQKQGQEE